MPASDFRSPKHRARIAEIVERDGDDCVWCRRPVDDRLIRPTIEHVIPRLKGGPSWLENEVIACRRCNAARSHRRLVDFADECERRGWAPDRDRLLRSLEAVTARIERDGGQRKARPWLASQLKQLRSHGS